MLTALQLTKGCLENCGNGKVRSVVVEIAWRLCGSRFKFICGHKQCRQYRGIRRI